VLLRSVDWQDACFAGAINLVHVVCSDSDPWLASLPRPSSESACHGNTSCHALPSAGARTVLRMVGTFTFMQLDQQKSMVLRSLTVFEVRPVRHFLDLKKVPESQQHACIS